MTGPRMVRLAALGLLFALTWRSGSGRADEAAAKKIYPTTLRGTVWLLAKVGNRSVSGSGWLADRERKLVVTCYHVVAGTDAVQVYFPAYKNDQALTDRTHYLQNVRPVPGRVLDRDSKRDLAVIELSWLPSEATELKLAAQSVATASTVHTVGNPGDAKDPLWKYTRGEVSSVYHKSLVLDGVQPVDATVVQTQEPINPGDSGGPVVNDDGELVAVNSATRKTQSLVSYAIDVTEVKAFMADALTYYNPESAADFRRRGLHYYGLQRFGAAAEDFTAALRLEPNDALTYRNRGEAYRNGSALEKAIADYVQVLRLNPQDEPALRERGVCFAALEQYDQAIEDLGKALHIAGDDRRARLWRAKSLRGKGDLEQALKDCDELLRDPPADLRALYHFERAQVFMAQPNYDKAVEDFEAAVELAPSSDDAAYDLALAYMKKGDVDRAIKSLDAAVKLNPGFVAALVKRGDAYAKKQDYDSAVADFSAALKLTDYAPAYAGRGAVYSRKGDFDKALADLNEALWRDPKDAASYAERARVRLALGAPKQAVDDATEAIRQKPSDAQVLARAFNERGVGYFRMGLQDQAIADFSKAIDYEPKSAVFYENRAESRFNNGEFEQAAADSSQAIELSPKYASAYLLRSRAYAKLGKDDESKKDHDKAVEYDPKLKK